MPRHRVTVATHVELPWAIGACVHYNRTWAAFLDDANVYEIEGPSTLDLRVRRAGLTLSF